MACLSSIASPSKMVRNPGLTGQSDMQVGFFPQACVAVAGEVTYRSKFLKSETYKKNCSSNRIVVSEFGTMVYPDPCKNIFSR